MKLPALALFSIPLASALAAPIPITGSTHYLQDFNNLVSTGANNSATSSAWADDSTIPGWWLFRAGNGTPTGFAGATYLYRISDGAIARQSTLPPLSVRASATRHVQDRRTLADVERTTSTWCICVYILIDVDVQR